MGFGPNRTAGASPAALSTVIGNPLKKTVPRASLTFTKMKNVPADCGVPESTAEPFSVNPTGRSPNDTASTVKGAKPPCGPSGVDGYGVPTMPGGSVLTLKSIEP